MRDISLVIVGMLLISLVPVGGVSSETVSASARAKGLLLALDRLANYTHQAGCNSDEADALRERAWELYRAGEYNQSAIEALRAMGLYRSTIALCKSGENESTEKTGWISIAETEVAIAANVLQYARKLIESGELSGEELRELEIEYNQTLLIYEGLMESLESNDTQDIAHKVAMLQTSRIELEKTLSTVVKVTVMEKATTLGKAQLERLDRLIERTNSTELILLRAELVQALNSGDSEKVLELLKRIPREISELERWGKLKSVPIITPGRPSFPGSSEEGFPGTVPGNMSAGRLGKDREGKP